MQIHLHTQRRQEMHKRKREPTEIKYGEYKIKRIKVFSYVEGHEDGDIWIEDEDDKYIVLRMLKGETYVHNGDKCDRIFAWGEEMMEVAKAFDILDQVDLEYFYEMGFEKSCDKVYTRIAGGGERDKPPEDSKCHMHTFRFRKKKEYKGTFISEGINCS